MVDGEGRYWTVIFLASVDLVCVFEAGDSIREGHVKGGIIWLMAAIILSLIGYNWPKLKKRLVSDNKQQIEANNKGEKPRAHEEINLEPVLGDLAKADGVPAEMKGPPITMKQLFEIDWQNLPAFYNECVLSSQIFESALVKVAWRVNGDFVGRSKFLAILIDPTTKAGDAFKACEAIADRFGHFIDSVNSEVDIKGQAPDDTAPTHLKDMVFSKRIFIYYEDFSLAQKGMLETIYQSKELSVQFRDAAYAWAHRDDKPRQTPLVPNSTILPDAKLNPGLRITVTKLSPGRSLNG